MNLAVRNCYFFFSKQTISYTNTQPKLHIVIKFALWLYDGELVKMDESKWEFHKEL